MQSYATLLVVILAAGAMVAGGARAAPGDLNVTVMQVGQPRANATVCVGTPENPRQYGQRTTNAQGVAAFSGLPHAQLLVTAHAGSMGVSTDRGRDRFGRYFETMHLTLPVAAGGPTCSGTVVSADPQPVFSPPDLSNVAPPPPDRVLGTTIPPVTTRVEYCFGALGAQCGGAQHGLPTTALCAAGMCRVNAGSWEHDECCFANPGGMACRVGPADAVLGHDGRCVTEWNKALNRLAAGLNWTRRVDFDRPNSTGRVEFDRYCAPAGTRLHTDDVRYCCSREGVPVQPLSRLENTAALRQCR